MSNTVENELRDQLNKWRRTKKVANWLIVVVFVWLVVQVAMLLLGKEVGIGDLLSSLLGVAIFAYLLLQAKNRIGSIESELSS